MLIWKFTTVLRRSLTMVKAAAHGKSQAAAGKAKELSKTVVRRSAQTGRFISKKAAEGEKAVKRAARAVEVHKVVRDVKTAAKPTTKRARLSSSSTRGDTTVIPRDLYRDLADSNAPDPAPGLRRMASMARERR